MFTEIVGEAHEAVRAAGVQPYLEMGGRGQKQGAERGSRGHSVLADPGPSLETASNRLGLNDTLPSCPFQQPLPPLSLYTEWVNSQLVLGKATGSII